MRLAGATLAPIRRPLSNQAHLLNSSSHCPGTTGCDRSASRSPLLPWQILVYNREQRRGIHRIAIGLYESKSLEFRGKPGSSDVRSPLEVGHVRTPHQLAPAPRTQLHETSSSHPPATISRCSTRICTLASVVPGPCPMSSRPDALIAYLIAHRVLYLTPIAQPYLFRTTRDSSRLPSPRVTYILGRAFVRLRCDLQAYLTRNIFFLPHDTHSPSSARASAERLNRALPRRAHTGAVIYSLRSQVSTSGAGQCIITLHI